MEEMDEDFLSSFFLAKVVSYIEMILSLSLSIFCAVVFALALFNPFKLVSMFKTFGSFHIVEDLSMSMTLVTIFSSLVIVGFTLSFSMILLNGVNEKNIGKCKTWFYLNLFFLIPGFGFIVYQAFIVPVSIIYNSIGIIYRATTIWLIHVFICDISKVKAVDGENN